MSEFDHKWNNKKSYNLFKCAQSNKEHLINEAAWENFKNSSNFVHRIREGVMNIKFNPMHFTDKGP